MVVSDAHVFPGFLTPVLTQFFFPMLPSTFLACFCKGDRQKYARKKVRLDQGLNSQPPGHESDTLITGAGLKVTEKLKVNSGRVENIERKGENSGYQQFLLFPQCFRKASPLGLVSSQDCVVKS